MAKTALVTGGAGFIGSHLARRLLGEGYRVRVLDNLSTGDARNLDGLEKDIELHEVDVRDYEAVRKAAHGADCIWHEAALASVPRSIDDPALTHEVNVTGSLNVLLAARDESVPRFVFASSSSVYGDTPALPKREEMTPTPVSPYAVQKLTVEHYARQFHLHYGIETVCLRYFNVFGPRQDPESPYAAVIPIFARRIQQGLPPVINGSGEHTRDFTYVDNVVDANLLAAKAEGVGGQVINIAGARRISVLELAQSVVKWFGWKGTIQYGPARQGDVLHSYADVSKAVDLLGYQPRVDFEEGLSLTLDWLAKEV
jgi:nucleoside-diphosphate-sugar epimerase